MTYAWVAAAVAGAATMALEVLTARRLAPAFGLTLSTWAVLIAATLLAGAVGALLGARFGGRPSRSGLAKALTVAACAAAFDAAAGAAVVRGLSGASPDLGAGLASLVLVGPAVAALAAVPPLAIALGAQDRPAGTIAGRVLAASTAGSLVGTLGVALVVLPLAGVARSTLGVAILCAVTALGVARRRAAYVVILAVVGASGAAWSAFDDPPDLDVVVARASPFGDVVLRARGPSLVLEVDGVAQGTRGPLVDGLAALRARGQASAALPILHPRARRALVIGLGAGALTTGLADAGLDVTTVDVNPVLVEVVAARWGIPGRVVVDDGRRASRSLAPGFDAVVLDAFQGEGVPWHLLTREAFEALRPRLAPGAIVVVHLVGRAEHRVTGAVSATLRATWPHGLAVRSTRGGALDDLFLWASDAPLSWPPHPECAACAPFEPPAGPVLTDDDSPLDRWNEPLARALRAASRR